MRNIVGFTESWFAKSWWLVGFCGLVACAGTSAGSTDAGVTADTVSADTTTSTCVPVSGDPQLIRLRGTVWTGDVTLNDGEVFVSAKTGKILCVGQDCSATPDAAFRCAA